MIPRACKRLAEVDFPIAAVSRHAVREKSIRHGHPSTLHLWWARRPLASSRAVLLALLLPDPCDPYCPEEFKVTAREMLPTIGSGRGETDVELRRGLLKFIADFANWDNSANRTWLDAGRSLVKAAHGGEPPLVVDPFAGGGSIPLEALRLGCETFASDLNPVACLILKVMLEDIPRHGPELADGLRKAGGEIKRQAGRALADLYPADPDGATPIAYLWARTVRCESPNCGAEIPLMRSLWLCRKAKRKRALRHSVERIDGAPPRVAFEVFEPKSETEVNAGTVTRARATCLCCGAVLPPERVRAQLAAQRGGADVVFDDEGKRSGGARLTAVVTLRPGASGRHYRLPSDADYAAVRTAQERLAGIIGEWEDGGKQGLCPVPDELLNPTRPSPNARGLSAVTRYGMSTFSDLFTARQKVALAELVRCVVRQGSVNEREGLAIIINRCANQLSHVSRWNVPGEKVEGTFARQALPIVWDYAEVNPFGNATGSYDGALDWVVEFIRSAPRCQIGQLQLSDATEHPLPDQTAGVWFTDPPYYDAIPYADLSDFFLVWLKRTLPDHPFLRDPFDPANPLSPKQQECVWNQSYNYEGQPKDAAFFETTISKAFAEGRRVLDENGAGCVVFAHKTTEGWEALLSGMIQGGWTVTGSWPIATEMGSRLNARETSSLATSVHLVCRPRPGDAPVGDWADVLRELPNRVSDWMARLQGEGVRGADLVFACIGPALEIFSRYRAVETAEGVEVGLPAYLEKVWEVVGRAALEQVLGTAEANAGDGLAGALEEDARLTALFLWTLQSTSEAPSSRAKTFGFAESDGVGFDQGPFADASPASAGPVPIDDENEERPRERSRSYNLPFDVVRRFSQPMGIDLERWTGRIIAQEKGVVRLVPVAERAKSLFGTDGVGGAADWMDTRTHADAQRTLFPDIDPAPNSPPSGRPHGNEPGADTFLQSPNSTALDRVHAAMLLQAGGHANALRTLIVAEQERGPDFLRLANALSALYPRGSSEKRLLDAMLLAVPR